MEIFKACELNIPYEDYKKLESAGKCYLGMPDDVAQNLYNAELNPSGSGVSIGVKLWKFAGFGLFSCSIYLSFIWEWWAFIPGFLVMGLIYKVTKKSISEIVLNDATNNEDFYYSVIQINKIPIKIDKSEVSKFIKN